MNRIAAALGTLLILATALSACETNMTVDIQNQTDSPVIFEDMAIGPTGSVYPLTTTAWQLGPAEQRSIGWLRTSAPGQIRMGIEAFATGSPAAEDSRSSGEDLPADELPLMGGLPTAVPVFCAMYAVPTPPPSHIHVDIEQGQLNCGPGLNVTVVNATDESVRVAWDHHRVEQPLQGRDQLFRKDPTLTVEGGTGSLHLLAPTESRKRLTILAMPEPINDPFDLRVEAYAADSSLVFCKMISVPLPSGDTMMNVDLTIESGVLDC